MKKVVITNETSKEKIPSVYFPLIEMVLFLYQEICADSLLEVRLLGSVARGEAHRGRSDIDFLALMREKPTELSLQLLDTSAKDVQRIYSFVSHVDMDVVNTANLSVFQRFVLETDSLHLFGRESFILKTQVLEAEQLARLVTPSMTELISAYRTALLSLPDPDQIPLSRMSRVTGKDLLKCLRYILIVHYGLYDKNITSLYQHLLLHLPDYTENICRLYTLYMQPVAEKQILLEVLDDAQQDLLPLLYHYGWPGADRENHQKPASPPGEQEY